MHQTSRLMKMSLLWITFVAVILVKSDGFFVRGPSGPLVFRLGGSLVLPCYVDEALPLKGLKVIWIKTDSNTLVHVYQDGESLPDAQYQDYYNRVHFFTDYIKNGNFSLHLKNVRAEDKGFYRCKVYTEQESDETLVQIKSVEHLVVSGSSHPISAYVGEDVTLNCSVDSHIPPEETDEVSWRKTDANITILGFEKNVVIPDERYRDRVEFFSAEISKGNFSLRLKNVRTEDKGVYMCYVSAGNFSANATVSLEQLGFSVFHILVLIFCIAASGSALLLSILWIQKNRSPNPDGAVYLLVSLALVPNLLMFFAFLFWGVSEGFVSETVACCAHYILRPCLLLWTAPHSKCFPGNRATTMHCVVQLQYSLFTNVVYSVLFQLFWEKSLKYTEIDRVFITILFGIMILICVINIIFLLAKFIRNKDGNMRALLDLVPNIGHDVLPPLQLIFLFYAFEAARRALFVIGVFPLFLTLTRYNWKNACMKKLERLRSLRRAAWLSFMIVVNVIVVYSYLITLEKEKDCVGWVCVATFLQVLWAIVFLKHSFGDLGQSEDDETPREKTDLPFRRIVYISGSVGIVLVNSIALISELILKKINGEHSVEDLRKAVFPSECLFAWFVLLLIIFEPFIKKVQQHFQNSAGSIPDNSSQQLSQEHSLSIIISFLTEMAFSWFCIFIYSCIQRFNKETSHDLSTQNHNTAELCELRPIRETEEQEAERNG